MNYVRYGLIVMLCMCMHVTVTEQVGVNEQDIRYGSPSESDKDILDCIIVCKKNERNKEQ